MTAALGVSFACLAATVLAGPQSFERRTTPIMGWASWNAFHKEIDAEKIRAQADCLVSLGLREFGWTFVNIDDCFQDGRDPVTGRLRVNEKKFPGGHAAMRALADYMHARGLKAGIYSDGGDHACSSGGGNDPTGRDIGFWRHETDDANMYLADGNYRDAYAQAHPEDPGIDCWGYDFIKIDWCGGDHAKLVDSEQYGKILDAIEAVERRMGKDKIVNICRWAYAGPWQFRADSWRSGPDIDANGGSWDSAMVQVDLLKGLWQYTRPGSMNDPDMLVAGLTMTPVEDVSHFAMWCMFSSPLLIGQDLRTIKPETLALYKNAELIALDQDPAVCCAAYVGDLVPGVEVWVKMLGSDRSDVRAVALLNRQNLSRTVTLDFRRAGYTGPAKARDLLAHVDLPADTSRTVTLPPHGIDILKLSPADRSKVLIPASVTDAASVPADPSVGRARRLDWPAALDKVAGGALLLDVRSPEEFAAGHADGAVNLPLPRVYEEATKIAPDTNRTIVCYCRTYKRADLAATELLRQGYRSVYFVGGGFSKYAERPKVALADVTRFVSDLPWQSPWPIGFGEHDKTWKGQPIKVGGRVFEKGIGTRPGDYVCGTLVVCPISSNATAFVSLAGVAADDAESASIRFSVQVDGVELSASPRLGRGESHFFAVGIPAGAKQLKLVTQGTPAKCDCCWAGAGFSFPPLTGRMNY